MSTKCFLLPVWFCKTKLKFAIIASGVVVGLSVVGGCSVVEKEKKWSASILPSISGWLPSDITSSLSGLIDIENIKELLDLGKVKEHLETAKDSFETMKESATDLLDFSSMSETFSEQMETAQEGFDYLKEVLGNFTSEDGFEEAMKSLVESFTNISQHTNNISSQVSDFLEYQLPDYGNTAVEFMTSKDTLRKAKEYIQIMITAIATLIKKPTDTTKEISEAWEEIKKNSAELTKFLVNLIKYIDKISLISQALGQAVNKAGSS